MSRYSKRFKQPAKAFTDVPIHTAKLRRCSSLHAAALRCWQFYLGVQTKQKWKLVHEFKCSTRLYFTWKHYWITNRKWVQIFNLENQWWINTPKVQLYRWSCVSECRPSVLIFLLNFVAVFNVYSLNHRKWVAVPQHTYESPVLCIVCFTLRFRRFYRITKRNKVREKQRQLFLTSDSKK
jgi:hypothetical protein